MQESEEKSELTDTGRRIRRAILDNISEISLIDGRTPRRYERGKRTKPRNEIEEDLLPSLFYLPARRESRKQERGEHEGFSSFFALGFQINELNSEGIFGNEDFSHVIGR